MSSILKIKSIISDPPSRPIFLVDGKSVNGSLRLISGKKVSVLCESDSYPSPTYLWTLTRRSEYRGQYLDVSKLDKSDTWQCTVTNNMTLPNKTTAYGNNSAKLQVHLLCEYLNYYIIFKDVLCSSFDKIFYSKKMI